MANQSPKTNNPIEKHFGKLGRYHYYFFFLLFLSKVPLFWHVLNMLFLAPPMSYHCGGKKNVKIINENNDGINSCPCEVPVWNTSVFTKTVQTKFNVVCDSAWLVYFSESMVFVGCLFGSLVFGCLSDIYGRLRIFTTCCLIVALFGCLVSTMPTIASYTCMRFIEGFGVGGAIVTGFVLLVEYCTAGQRETITALYHLPINFGHMSLAGVSYFLRDCDQFQLAVSVPMFLFVAMYWITLESPKWLMDNDRLDEAAAVMQNFFKFNKQSNETIRAEMEQYSAELAKTKRRKVKFWQIFKHKSLVINLACMSFIYFVCGMGYYGVSQYIGKMSGDIHLNVAISGALLIPGTIAAVFLLKILNRRPFLMGTNIISGVLMLVVVCVPSDMHWVRVIIACVCNCFFFMSFIIVFLYGVELFPTSVRNSVLGLLAVLSRLGQIVAPPLNTLPEHASGSIFGVCALIGAALCYPLPETKDVELPASLEDSKTLPHKRLSLTNKN